MGDQAPETIGLPADVDAASKAAESNKADELAGDVAITHVVVHTAAAEEEDGKQPEVVDDDEKAASESEQKVDDKPAVRQRRISSSLPPPYHLERDVDAAIPKVIREAEEQTAKENEGKGRYPGVGSKFVSTVKAARHGRRVVAILEPFAAKLNGQIENVQKAIETKVPEVDALFDGFADEAPPGIDLAELGWPHQPLSRKLLPALRSAAPSQPIARFSAKFAELKKTLAAMGGGELVGAAAGSLGDDEQDSRLAGYQKLLNEVLEAVEAVHAGFEVMWKVSRRVSELLLGMFAKVKEYATSLSTAAKEAMEVYEAKACAISRALENALADAEAASGQVATKAKASLEEGSAAARQEYETALEAANEAMGQALEAAAEAFDSVAEVADEVLREGTQRVDAALKEAEEVARGKCSEAKKVSEQAFEERAAEATRVFDDAVDKLAVARQAAAAAARKELATATDDSRRKLNEAQTAIAELQRRINKAKRSVIGAWVSGDNVELMQAEIEQKVRTVCDPMREHIAAGEDECEKAFRAADLEMEAGVRVAEDARHIAMEQAKGVRDAAVGVAEGQEEAELKSARERFERDKAEVEQEAAAIRGKAEASRAKAEAKARDECADATAQAEERLARSLEELEATHDEVVQNAQQAKAKAEQEARAASAEATEQAVSARGDAMLLAGKGLDRGDRYAERVDSGMRATTGEEIDKADGETDYYFLTIARQLAEANKEAEGDLNGQGSKGGCACCVVM